MCLDNFLEIDGTKTYTLRNFFIEKYESKCGGYDRTHSA